MTAESKLSLTGKRWLPPKPAPKTLPAVSGHPKWLLELLSTRGYEDAESIQRYLNPSLAQLDDPGLMADMGAAVSRVEKAIHDGEKIVVYGDYDVDGVTSTTVVVESLQGLGANVDYYLPDRQKEGYGLNGDAVLEISASADLLITCDCGITANEEVALAKKNDTDVIIVDHHTVPDILPPADACLDPLRQDCDFPFKGLCAAGVAFMFMGALRRSLREKNYFADRDEPDMRDLLDIVAIATVADMVPMVGLNRVLVKAGMERMARDKRLGLWALLNVSEVDRKRVSTYDLGFRVGPRINARGRISHAKDAVELFLTQDKARATILASTLDMANKDRRILEKRTVDAAIAKFQSSPFRDAPGIVIEDPSWHPGVLGLVASRLVSHYNRPAIVIGDGGKGSGRSIDGLDLHAAMKAASHHTLRFGGHKAAAGLTIEKNKIQSFRKDFCAAILQQIGKPPYIKELQPDLELASGVLSLALVDDLERLAPFGQTNSEPLFLARNLPVRGQRIVGQDHLKLNLDGHDAIGFRMGGVLANLPSHVDALFRLERNLFRGRETLQLRLEDLACSE